MTAPTIASITVLTCVEGKRCAKAYGEDLTQPPEPFDAGFLFEVETVPVAGLADCTGSMVGTWMKVWSLRAPRPRLSRRRAKPARCP